MDDRTTRGRVAGRRLRRPVLGLLTSITGSPALIRNRHLDLIAANELGYALYDPVFMERKRSNLARFVFIDEERSQQFFHDWERVGDECVHLLRGAADRNPYDKALQRLVGELSTRSRSFRQRWSSVRGCGARPPSERIHHPTAGRLELLREELDVKSETDLTLTIYLPSNGAAAERLGILASWCLPMSTKTVNRT